MLTINVSIPNLMVALFVQIQSKQFLKGSLYRDPTLLGILQLLIRWLVGRTCDVATICEIRSV